MSNGNNEIKILDVSEMRGIFEDGFKIPMEDEKLENLIKYFGIERISMVFMYFSINGIKPPTNGKKPNPWGLVFKLCSEWNFNF